ncbi:transposase [Pseudomonas sp. J452]|uniref:REP-associated tyrosine transposase n=1 Tax=Pseudomonas sp. J452 TaxID=2898441 RepID=UPI0021AE1685|nr:transposase [Pseudomonas sp. J452]UUY10351.1 transposase [Pseudomonas sp. J452]
MDSSLFAHRGHALRRGRICEPGRIYLLTAITHERKAVFQNWQLARLLVKEMRYLHDAGGVESLAWVVMPDHLHWLVGLGAMPLSQLMQNTKSRSAITINRVSGRTGEKVWLKGFHDHALRAEEDLQAVARYVVANPLRAGLVQRLGDYPLWDAI